MNYDQVYLRNIGIFTGRQQARLRQAKITVAGVGGVGGIQAVTLARMGIGEMTIMDPGVFDEPDMNRQYAAMKNTIGQNKARATAGLLKKIIASGAAFAKFKEMAAFHGADVTALDDLSKLPKASIVKPFPAPAAG